MTARDDLEAAVRQQRRPGFRLTDQLEPGVVAPPEHEHRLGDALQLGIRESVLARFGIRPAERDAARVRDSRNVGAVDNHVDCSERTFECVAQRTDVREIARDLRGHSERHRQRHVLRTGAAAALLRAAECVAREREAASDVERADAFRRVQLVRGERERVDAERVHIDVDLARALHGIAVHVNRSLAADARHVRDRLDHARLVVREHHRDEPRFGTERGDDCVRVDDPAARRRDDRDRVAAALQLGNRLQHRGVLDRGCDNVLTDIGAGRAEDGRIVRLRTAARKDDVPRFRGDQFRHRVAGILDRAARGLAFFMNARCIAKDIPQRCSDRFQHGWMQRSRRVVVEVDSHAICLLSFGSARSPR